MLVLRSPATRRPSAPSPATSTRSTPPAARGAARRRSRGTAWATSRRCGRSPRPRPSRRSEDGPVVPVVMCVWRRSRSCRRRSPSSSARSACARSCTSGSTTPAVADDARRIAAAAGSRSTITVSPRTSAGSALPRRRELAGAPPVRRLRRRRPGLRRARACASSSTRPARAGSSPVRVPARVPAQLLAAPAAVAGRPRPVRGDRRHDRRRRDLLRPARGRLPGTFSFVEDLWLSYSPSTNSAGRSSVRRRASARSRTAATSGPPCPRTSRATSCATSSRTAGRCPPGRLRDATAGCPRPPARHCACASPRRPPEPPRPWSPAPGHSPRPGRPAPRRRLARQRRRCRPSARRSSAATTDADVLAAVEHRRVPGGLALGHVRERVAERPQHGRLARRGHVGPWPAEVQRDVAARAPHGRPSPRRAGRRRRGRGGRARPRSRGPAAGARSLRRRRSARRRA